MLTALHSAMYTVLSFDLVVNAWHPCIFNVFQSVLSLQEYNLPYLYGLELNVSFA